MSAIGNTLKEARSKKAVTLEDVHAKTKIHPRVLQLLEDEKFDKLPSPLFVKSFLKTYAEFLEVDPQELIQAYEKEWKKEPEQFLFIKSPQRRAQRVGSSIHFNKNLLVLPGVLVVAVFALWVLVGAFKMVGGWFSDSKRSPRSAQKTPASGSSKVVAAVSQKSIDPRWLYYVSLDDFPKIAEKTPITLKIRALNDVWLRITCDGKVLFESLLKKGAAESWTAGKTIEIWTGNSSNMRLSINGSGLKPSANKAGVKKMLVSHEGIKIVA